MIDAVLLWVDGSDPEFRRRKDEVLGRDSRLTADEVGGDTRYAALGELSWSVASINRFMPWIRRIFIVTDRQDPTPQLRLTMEHFENPIPVEVVDHSVIYRGMDDLIPVFNSLSIETLIWRIPGLSRRYIYFNDDMFVMAPMKPEDWFDGDRLIVHGRRLPLIVAQVAEKFRRGRDGKPAQGFKTPMIATAKLLGTRHFVYYYHSPLAQDRELLERFFESHKDAMRANAAPKFRESQQFSTHVLCTMLAEREGRLRIDNEDTNLFLKPLASRPEYLTERLRRADCNKRLRLGCISSLDRASEEQRKEFERWIIRRVTS
ncbi:MAG: Stealth CR1 domain-containing protein [Muribaculaceae bacterium]|nr:Stealth CR1 domain-containing protein [Muribaculaceae bacterium]